MTMKLYYAPGTCAIACWIALEWANGDYEAVRADYASEEYKRINPLAAVPALDIGGKRAVTQAAAILQYIADLYPAAGIGASEGLENAFELNETMSFLASDLHPAFWPFFFPQRYTTATDEAALKAVKEASYARVDRAMQHLDKLIGDTGHVYQGRRSIADAYAFAMVRWTEMLPKTWREYPNIAAFMNRMNEDKSVQHVMQAQKG
ncbi:MAG: glutathione binding-like protein [Lautropia sp.]|nr:glutathione binding-like protein [Lautropia sp.]